MAGPLTVGADDLAIVVIDVCVLQSVFGMIGAGYQIFLRWNAKRYPGTSPGTFSIEGETEPGRLIAVFTSELQDSRGRVAYVVTAFPIRRYSVDPTVV